MWVTSENLKSTRPTQKLDDKWRGPFEIVSKKGESSYELKLPSSWKVHPVFNEARLKPYIPLAFESQKKDPPPPPDLIGDELEYEVEEVLDSRIQRKKLQYLVKWKGYPNEENTWEPEDCLANAKDRVTAFHKQYPSAPCRLNVKLAFVSYDNLTEHSSLSTSWRNGKQEGKGSHADATLKGG